MCTIRRSLFTLPFSPNTLQTRHVLTGQIPPQQQPLWHGQQFSEVSSPSKLPRERLCPGKQMFAMCKLLHWPWRYMGQGHDTPLCQGRRVKYYPDLTWHWGIMARTRILVMCALWYWPWRYGLVSRSWHTFGSWTTLVWNIIQIQHGSEELWPGHGFLVCLHCDLDLRDMTLGQCHDTPLGHGQQLCKVVFKSNMAMRSYGPDTDFGYRCTLTLTLKIWVKVMTHPWVMDNNCVKYYPDQTSQWGGMAQTRILGMCALWPCPWRFDLGQCHDTPLGHGQQSCEILSRSNIAVRSYGPDTEFGYACTVTLTLGIWPWV